MHGKNYIIGVMGKKGSGKSHLVKEAVRRMKRYLVIDVLHEYKDGVIYEDWKSALEFIRGYQDGDFRVVFRPPDGDEEDQLERIFEGVNLIDNYTLVLEEADYHCNPYYITPHIKRLIKYGRHYGRNLLWISRNAAEVNRNLTRQSDLLITFVQTEPIDIKYLNQFSFGKPPATLEKFQFALSGDVHLYSTLWGKKSS